MERLGDEVERELARRSAGDTVAISRIVAVWPDAVGSAVARNAWPLRVGRDGTLHVATASATWAFELDRLAPEILDRLTGLIGERAPSAVRFRPGPLPEPAPAPAAPDTTGAGAPAPLPRAVVEEAAAAASEIHDPELREMVERAARASLARGRSGRAI